MESVDDFLSTCLRAFHEFFLRCQWRDNIVESIAALNETDGSRRFYSFPDIATPKIFSGIHQNQFSPENSREACPEQFVDSDDLRTLSRMIRTSDPNHKRPSVKRHLGTFRLSPNAPIWKFFQSSGRFRKSLEISELRQNRLTLGPLWFGSLVRIIDDKLSQVIGQVNPMSVLAFLTPFLLEI